MMCVDEPVVQAPATEELRIQLNEDFKNAGIPYIAILHNKQFAFVTTDETTGHDFRKLVQIVWNKHNRYFVVNTATHGTQDGSINVYLEEQHYKDVVKFIREDIRTIFNVSGVSLHIVSSMSRPVYPLDKDSVDAWCYSEKKFEQRLALSRTFSKLFLFGHLFTGESVIERSELYSTISY